MEKIAAKGGFKSAGHFLKAVALAGRGEITPELAAWQKTAGHMAEGDDSQGGFLVPTQFLVDLKMQTMLDDGIPGRCTAIPADSARISIPYVADTSHTGGVYGGVVVKRTGEGAQKLYSKPALGLCTLTLHKLTVLTYVSEELIEDSPSSIAAMFAMMFPEALSHTVANDIISGSGAGQGLGIINAPATITVPRAGAGAIAWADIVGMWERLYPRHAQSVWLANPDTFPDLAQMVQVGAVPVWHPADAPISGGHLPFMGRPLILTEHCPALGNPGDIILADLSQMLLARKGPKVDSSIHLRYDYDEATFRAEVRYDCQPWWPAPVTPKHGTQTVSPFVILGDVAGTTTTGAATTTAAATTTTVATVKTRAHVRNRRMMGLLSSVFSSSNTVEPLLGSVTQRCP